MCNEPSEPTPNPATAQELAELSRLKREIETILRTSPLESPYWTGEHNLMPQALAMLVRIEEGHYQAKHHRPLPGVSGFVLQLEGGTCVAITHFSARRNTLTVRSQAMANIVLFTLIHNKFLPETIPSEWGDVLVIDSFRLTNETDAPYQFQFDHLWLGEGVNSK